MPVKLPLTNKRLPQHFLIPTDELRRIFLRLVAANWFAKNADEAFYEHAAQSDGVIDGDWEAAGIKKENDPNIKIAEEILKPLEEKWNDVKEYWKKEGVDVDDDNLQIHEVEDPNYKDNVQDYANDDVTEEGINDAIDGFVSAMLKPLE
jgi:hypothetical protein